MSWRPYTLSGVIDALNQDAEQQISLDQAELLNIIGTDPENVKVADSLTGSNETPALAYEAGVLPTSGGWARSKLSSVTAYTIQTGDFLEYDIWEPARADGLPQHMFFDLLQSGGSKLRDSGAVDQNGILAGADSGKFSAGRWYHRKIAIPVGWVGVSVTGFVLACDGDFGSAAISTMPYPAAVLARHPWGYWRLNDALSSTTVADSSGLSHGGTVSGTVTFQQTGLLNTDTDKAALFNAGSFTVADALQTRNNGAFSIALWLNQAAARLYTLAEKGNPLGTGWELSILASGAVSYQQGNLAALSTAAGLIANATAHFVALTYDDIARSDGTAGTLSIYVDGVLKAAAGYSFPLNTDTSVLQVGQGTFSGGNADATFDDVAFFLTCLSPADVAALNQAGSQTPPTIYLISSFNNVQITNGAGTQRKHIWMSGDATPAISTDTSNPGGNSMIATAIPAFHAMTWDASPWGLGVWA